MKLEQARRLVERSGVLRSRCDLDLLLFFVRHPYSLLTSDQLATFIGQDVKDVGSSLDVLLNAGLLKRSQSPSHSARLYAFSTSSPNGGWLPSLVDFASTREGRLAILEVLGERSGDRTTGPAEARTSNRLRIVKLG
jgi:hypothetical protein